MAEMKADIIGLLIERHGERARIKVDKEKSKGALYKGRPFCIFFRSSGNVL